MIPARTTGRWFALAAVFLVSCAPAMRRGLAVEEEPGLRPWTGLDAGGGEEFHFAVIGDRTGGHREGVFGRALDMLNLLQPDFVVSIGDLIEGYTSDSTVLDEQWREFDSLLAPLTMPFFRLAGNHDLLTPESERAWNSRYGRPYYHFVYKNALFLCLSTTVDGDTATLDSQQLSYIRRTLTGNPKPRWTFVFLHHPLWLYGHDTLWTKVASILGEREYTAFAGHWHRFVKRDVDGREAYVVATAGGGFPREGEAHEKFDHITWVSVGRQKKPRIALVPLDGVIHPDSLRARVPDTMALEPGTESP